MILIDDRTGSKHLAPMLKARGVPVKMSRLKAGDVAIVGSGPGGAAVKIGVEIKRSPELVDEIRSGHLVGTQLPKLQRLYFEAWLLVQGHYHLEGDQLNTAGLVLMYSEYEGFLITMRSKAQLKVKETADVEDTVSFLKVLHGWWTGKDYEKHRAHIAMDRSVSHLSPMPDPVRTFYNGIPGVGFIKAEALRNAYPTPKSLVDALPSEILGKVEGVGPKLAGRIRRFLWEAKIR